MFRKDSNGDITVRGLIISRSNREIKINKI